MVTLSEAINGKYPPKQFEDLYKLTNTLSKTVQQSLAKYYVTQQSFAPIIQDLNRKLIDIQPIFNDMLLSATTSSFILGQKVQMLQDIVNQLDYSKINNVNKSFIEFQERINKMDFSQLFPRENHQNNSIENNNKSDSWKENTEYRTQNKTNQEIETLASESFSKVSKFVKHSTLHLSSNELLQGAVIGQIFSDFIELVLSQPEQRILILTVLYFAIFFYLPKHK